MPIEIFNEIHLLKRGVFPAAIGLLFFLVTMNVTVGKAQDIHFLLTASRWIPAAQASQSEQAKFPEYTTFQADGIFFIEIKEAQYKVEGKWKWTAPDEFYVLPLSVTLKGVQEDFQQRLGYYYKIIEITEQRLKVRVRFETDTWESGFVRESVYVRDAGEGKN
jgi:hypothetical protein